METPINKKEAMKSITFTPTGEVRPPKEGEWIKTPDGAFSKAYFDFKQSVVPIYTMTESDAQTDDNSPIQGSSLNTQKELEEMKEIDQVQDFIDESEILGVSEPSLVQENVDSRCGAPTTYEQQIASLKAKIQSCKLNHEYLANSHEYPCPWCEIVRRDLKNEKLRDWLYLFIKPEDGESMMDALKREHQEKYDVAYGWKKSGKTGETL